MLLIHKSTQFRCFSEIDTSFREIQIPGGIPNLGRKAFSKW